MAYSYNQSYKEKEDLINQLRIDNGLTGTVPEFRYNKGYKEKEDILNAIMTAVDPAYSGSGKVGNKVNTQGGDAHNKIKLTGFAPELVAKDGGVRYLYTNETTGYIPVVDDPDYEKLGGYGSNSQVCS